MASSNFTGELSWLADLDMGNGNGTVQVVSNVVEGSPENNIITIVRELSSENMEEQPQEIIYYVCEDVKKTEVYPQCDTLVTSSSELKIEPHLEILEQPQEKFRFRYSSELKCPHGKIQGLNSNKKVGKTFPKVKLQNVTEDAVIRCSLYTAEENLRIPHVHQVIESGRKLMNYIEKNATASTQYEAEFCEISILQTAKRNCKPILKAKKEELCLEETKRSKRDLKVDKLTSAQKVKINKEVEEQHGKINMNHVCLRFDAFKKERGFLYPICGPVYSNTISSMKSASTAELKILHTSRCAGSCEGGDEIMLFTSKLRKGDVEVIFCEEHDFKEVWHKKAEIVIFHNQCGIIFRTPQYHDTSIAEPVQVFYYLQRPRTRERSEPMEFRYKSVASVARKKRKHSMEESTASSIGVRKFPAHSAVKSVFYPDLPAPNRNIVQQECLVGSSNISIAEPCITNWPAANETVPISGIHTGPVSNMKNEGQEISIPNVSFSSSGNEIFTWKASNEAMAAFPIGQEVTVNSVSVDPLPSVPPCVKDAVTLMNLDMMATEHDPLLSSSRSLSIPIDVNVGTSTGQEATLEEFSKDMWDYIMEQGYEDLVDDSNGKSTPADGNLEMDGISLFRRSEYHVQDHRSCRNKNIHIQKGGRIEHQMDTRGISSEPLEIVRHQMDTRGISLEPLEMVVPQMDTRSTIKSLGRAFPKSLGREEREHQMDTSGISNEALRKKVEELFLSERKVGGLTKEKMFKLDQEAVMKYPTSSPDFTALDDYGNNILHRAVLDSNNNIVESVVGNLKNGQITSLINFQNNDGQSPLHLAILLKNLKVVQLLIGAGSNLNVVNHDGDSLLHLAAFDNIECLEELLKNNATLNLNSKNHKDGATPLQMAVLNGCLPSVKLLVGAGAKVNEPNMSTKSTALHIAVERGNLEIAKFLIEKTNIEINSQNSHGNTPLHLACKSGNKDMCGMLLEANANPFYVNNIISKDQGGEESDSDDDDYHTAEGEEESSSEEELFGQTPKDLAKNNEDVSLLLEKACNNFCEE